MLSNMVRIWRLINRKLCLFRRRAEHTSFLLDLPLEIVQEIFDYLSLPAQILFSQTCTALHNVFFHQCLLSMRSVPHEQRLHALVELGRILPNKSVCFVCTALHKIDINDTPIDKTRDVFYRACYCPSTESEVTQRRYECTGHYSISFRHVSTLR